MLKKLALLFFAAVLIGSCKRDLYQPELASLNSIKNWYRDNSAIMAADANWLNGLSPDWSRIRTQNRENGNVYEIALNNPRKVFSAARTVEAKTARKLAPKSRLRLMVFENQFGPGLKACIMEITATGENSLPSDIGYKNYKDLTGLVNFYELDGRLANGWMYSGGRAIKSTGGNLSGLNPVSAAPSGANGKTMLVPAGTIECGRVPVPHIRTVCIGTGAANGWGYENGSGGDTYCRDEVYYQDEILYCPVDLDEGDSGGGYGGGGGGSTNPSNTSTDPDCGKVKTQTSSEAYKEKATDLKGKTDLKKETGYQEKKDGSFSAMGSNGSDGLGGDELNSEIKGMIHSHLDPYESPKNDGSMNMPIRMFSPTDVNTLMRLADINKASGNFSDYYVSMVSSYGHYMIKFSGAASDIKTGFDSDDWADQYREFMDKYTNLEKAFLMFLKDKMGVTGVKLYEVKNNGDIKTIELKADGKSVNKKDC